MGIQKVKSENTGVETKLVKVRNPWAREYFKGPWSDSSEKWTAEMLNQVEHEADNDGVYFIELADFSINFETMTVAEDV